MAAKQHLERHARTIGWFLFLSMVVGSVLVWALTEWPWYGKLGATVAIVFGALVGFGLILPDDDRQQDARRRGRRRGPQRGSAQEPALPERPGLTVLLSGEAAPDRADVLAELRKISGDRETTLEALADQDDVAAWQWSLRGHSGMAMFVPGPAPGLDEEIQLTRRPNEELADLRKHRGHIVLIYDEGPEAGGERWAALLALAIACHRQGLLGAIMTPARQCLTRQVLGDLAKGGWKLLAKDPGPNPAMVNLVPMQGDGEVWYATRGAPVYGIPEVAFHDDGSLPAPAVNHLVYNMLAYQHDHGAQLRVGETASQGDMQLAVIALPRDLADFISGGAPCVALTRVAT